jgi:hypothetical protein
VPASAPRLPPRTVRSSGNDAPIRRVSAAGGSTLEVQGDPLPRNRREARETRGRSAWSRALVPSRVYAGSTSLSFEVFGRHRGRARSLASCDFARLCASCDDTCSTLVMKGSAVRIRASALAICSDFLPRRAARVVALVAEGSIRHWRSFSSSLRMKRSRVDGGRACRAGPCLTRGRSAVRSRHRPQVPRRAVSGRLTGGMRSLSYLRPYWRNQ